MISFIFNKNALLCMLLWIQMTNISQTLHAHAHDPVRSLLRDKIFGKYSLKHQAMLRFSKHRCDFHSIQHADPSKLA
uniref:Putative secreted protein n=1 Tax=Anopheles darlingi TaxID=43151 RepID=A0A2M4DCS2_ANODA